MDLNNFIVLEKLMADLNNFMVLWRFILDLVLFDLKKFKVMGRFIFDLHSKILVFFIWFFINLLKFISIIM